MADDTELRARAVSAAEKAIGAASFTSSYLGQPGSARVVAQVVVDAAWPLVEARCRLLEAERNTAIQQGREQAARSVPRIELTDVAAIAPGADRNVDRFYFAAGYNEALNRVVAAVRGLPVPETNQEQQT